MRILYLTTILFSKNCNGGEVVSQCFIDTLRQQGHTVDVVGYQRKGDRLDLDPDATVVVDERHTETTKSRLSALGWYILAVVKRLPYSSAKYYSYRYKQLLRSRFATVPYNVVVLDHAQLGWLLDEINPAVRNIVFVAHNIEHEMYLQQAQKTKNPIARWVYLREERLIQGLEDRIARSVAAIWALTAHDAAYFARLHPRSNAKELMLPSGSGKQLAGPLAKKFDIGLLGSWSWSANQEALHWFMKEIYPNLPSNLSICVAGKGADWLYGQYDNVEYVGVVPSAQSFMAQARVFAIPTLRGGGIQIKTLDAIAAGIPIVATPIALRGIADPPNTVRVAVTAENFALQLLESLNSDEAEYAFKDAQTWFQARYQTFLTEIDSTLSDFEPILH